MVDRIYFDHKPVNPDIHGEAVYFYTDIMEETEKGGWSALLDRQITTNQYLAEQQTRIEELSDAIIELDEGE